MGYGARRPRLRVGDYVFLSKDGVGGAVVQACHDMGHGMWQVRVCEGWFDTDALAREEWRVRATLFQSFAPLGIDLKDGFARIVDSASLTADVVPVDEMWAEAINRPVVLSRVRSGYRDVRVGDLKMGAWGYGAFENDDAADWIFELEEQGVAAIDRAFAAVQEVGDDYLEVPEASTAFAAAESVARALGRPPAEVAPQEVVDKWVGSEGSAVTDAQRVAALAALDRMVATGSELLELWSEAGDEDAFRARVAELRARLGEAG